MTVDEMLELAKDHLADEEGSPKAYDHRHCCPLARAVIELLSTEPAASVHVVLPVEMNRLGVMSVSPAISIHPAPVFMTPAEARALAVALLRAADDAEKESAMTGDTAKARERCIARGVTMDSNGRFMPANTEEWQIFIEEFGLDMRTPDNVWLVGDKK